MPTERKIKQVAYIQDRLSRCTVAVTTRNNGISVAQVNELRRKLRTASVEYLVVKNNLAGIAADNAGKPGLRDILQGPTAIAFGYGEVVDPARTLHEEIRSASLPIELLGAIVDGQTLDAAAVRELRPAAAQADPHVEGDGRPAQPALRPLLRPDLSH